MLLEELDSFLSKNEPGDPAANYVALGAYYAEEISSPITQGNSLEAI
jgi:hypothetical protein